MGSTIRNAIKADSRRADSQISARMIKLATGTDLTVTISGRSRASISGSRAASTASSAPSRNPAKKPSAMRRRL